MDALHCAKKCKDLNDGSLKPPSVVDLRLSRICMSRKEKRERIKRRKEKEEERTPSLITPIKISGISFGFMNRKSTN